MAAGGEKRGGGHEVLRLSEDHSTNGPQDQLLRRRQIANPKNNVPATMA